MQILWHIYPYDDGLIQCENEMLIHNTVHLDWHGLTLIPEWTSNHMLSTVWDEITYPFQNVNVVTIKVLEWISHFIPHFIMDMITYTCWD